MLRISNRSVSGRWARYALLTLFFFAPLLGGAAANGQDFVAAAHSKGAVLAALGSFSEAAKSASVALANRSADFLQMVFGNVCRLSRVEVVGAYHVSEPALMRRAGLEQAPFLWQLSGEDIVRKIKTDPWVDKASLHWRFLPLALTISIEEKEPWIVAEMGADTWLVSRTGTLIENLSTVQEPELILESAELPRLDGIAQQKDAASDASNARFLYAVRVLKLIDAAGSVPFASERYTVLPDGGVSVTPQEEGKFPRVLLQVQNFSEARDSLTRLRLTLTDLAARGEGAESIDLRFNSQAVITPMPSEPPPPRKTKAKGR